MSVVGRCGRGGLGLWLALALAGSARAQAPEDLECLIQPQESVTLAFAVEGVVQDVLVERGELVTKGQPLAHLVADVEQAALGVAKARAEARAGVENGRAQLAYAKRALKRQETLKQENVVAEGLADQAARDEQVARALLLDAEEQRRIAGLEVERASAVLAMRRVESPFDAVVVERLLAPGEWADPPQVLKLAQIDPLRVEVFAPLALLGRVQVGTRARVMPEEPVGGRFEAEVTVVDRVVDAASGTFGVRLRLPNPDYQLPAGIRCRIRFEDLSLAVGGAPPVPPTE